MADIETKVNDLAGEEVISHRVDGKLTLYHSKVPVIHQAICDILEEYKKARIIRTPDEDPTTTSPVTTPAPPASIVHLSQQPDKARRKLQYDSDDSVPPSRLETEFTTEPSPSWNITRTSNLRMSRR